MKQSLQRKINAYRQAKTTKKSFEGFMEQKKNALKLLMEQQSIEQQATSSLLRLEKQTKYSQTSQFSKRLEFKEQEYLRQLEDIQNLKLEAIQKMQQLQGLKIDVSIQRNSYQTLEQALRKEHLKAQNHIDQIVQRQSQELKKNAQMFNQRHKDNLDHIEKLINEKEKQNEIIMNFLNKKKKFQKDQKQLKENHEKTLKESKKQWAQQDAQSREKWQKQKKQQTNENTLRGIEPEIQRIINSSKTEIKKIEEKYDIIKEEYRAEKVKEYEKRAMQMRNESFALVEQQKMKILSEYSEKLKAQFQALEDQFQKDRKKIRAQREQEIRQLEQKRKNETQEFILNNKDFYTIHLQQVKAIKEEYEHQIKQLDGTYELEIEKEEVAIRAKFNERLQRDRQAKRKELEQRIKTFTIQYEKQSESMYQDLVEKVAVDNDLYENQVRAKTQQKIKEMREDHEGEMRKLKKTIQILQAKLGKLTKETISKKQQRQESQQALQQMKRENQYLQRKISQYENDLLLKKLSIQNNSNINSHPDLKALTLQWREQIDKARESYLALEKEVQQSQEIMAEKIAQLRTDYSENVNLLEKNSLKLLTMKKNQIAKLKADKEMQDKYGQGLDQMIKKQKVMLEKFQQQQKAMLSGRRSSVQN